ncbi:AEC family transporter [Petrocella sp. FN5]|uniref:AEC family transporter n=1 Tax=Petrocella sp. FN5 TaxID=3032002 RepID=UPI0023DA1A80|nr:AEC family transporter [Petrocella sp. FN5]MDF1616272.1 AEC family transporter [Petrocella sp. FN5]
MDFSLVITQVIILFFIMLLGYVLRSKHIITDEGIKNFSSLIFYVTMPAMIIASLGNTATTKLSDLYDIALATFLTYIILIGMAPVLTKLVKVPIGSKGLYRFMVIFGNVGFIGFPMIIALLGEDALFMAAIFNIPFNLLLYTLGVYLILSDKNKNHKIEWSVKQFMNPGIIATLIGITSFLTGWKLPSTILNISDVLGGITTPLAMIVVGASLFGVQLKTIFKNYRIFLLSLIRMILFPLGVGFVLSSIGLTGYGLWVPIILSGMPIGTNTVIMARQYEGNTLEASEAVFLSTLMMVLTIPILIMIVGLYT